MPVEPLTAKQREFVDAIQHLTRLRQYPPTAQELAAHLNLAVSTAGGYLARLTRKGVLIRPHGGCRTVRVADRYCSEPAPEGFSTVPVMGTDGQIEHRRLCRVLNHTMRAFLLDIEKIGPNSQNVRAGDRVIVDPGRPPRLGFPCVVIGEGGKQLLLVEAFTAETLKLPGIRAAIIGFIRSLADHPASKSVGSLGVELAG